MLVTAVAEDHVHVLRSVALNARDLMRVFAELQHRLRAHMAGQLGVCDLVREPSQVTGRVNPDEEVGAPLPAPVEEERLIDGVPPLAHRRDGGIVGGLELCERGCMSRRGGVEALDAAAGAFELGQPARLMSLAKPPQQVAHGRGRRRQLLSVGHSQRQLRQVLTGEKISEIRGAEQEPAFEATHQRRMVGRSGSRS